MTKSWNLLQSSLRITALKLLFVSTSLTAFVSCGIITNGSNLDVVTANGSIQTINMAPRHYRVKEHCIDIVNKATPNLVASVAPLSPEQKVTIPWLNRVSNYRSSDCQSFKKRGAMMTDYDNIFSHRVDKIGILLPPSAANEQALQTILGELKAALARNGVRDPNALIIKRIEKREDYALKAASELIYIDRVSLLIGFNSIHTNALVKLSDPAQVPVFMVNPNTSHAKSVQTMRVYPPVDRLAQKLLDAYLAKSVTHTTVLYPKGAELDLLEHLKKIGSNKIYFMESSYDPTSNSDLLSTVKGAASRMALVRSKSQGLLILDNFKMVRHIVNILRSTLSDLNVVMTGNQQWRSPALLTPREEALEGAMFVDFIGSYADLPDGLSVPMPESPYFTTAQAASRIDYQIVGHRLGTLSAQILKRNWSRQRIATELQSMKNSWDNYFPVGEPIFDSTRDSTWPAVMFKVQGETIAIMPQ